VDAIAGLEGGARLNDSSTSPLISVVKEYFRRSDAGDFPTELFSPDFQFFFPKYGTGRGPDQFRELAEGMQRKLELTSIQHDVDGALYIEQGDHVVVEGKTAGSTRDGARWKGGETPGGRFCSVFAFNANGVINRMHIYLDPDYTGRDSEGFAWPSRSDGPW
jgi:ketosteroid isomerase-like protein